MYYILFRKGDDLMWGFDNSTMNCCICGKTQGKYVLKGLNGKICDQCQKILAIFDLVIWLRRRHILQIFKSNPIWLKNL